MNDSERKGAKSGSSDTSQIKEVTDNNMGNDTRNHSYTERKIGRKLDITENRRDEFDDEFKTDKKHTYEVTDWENEVEGVYTDYNHQTYADTVRTDEVQLDKTVPGNILLW